MKIQKSNFIETTTSLFCFTFYLSLSASSLSPRPPLFLIEQDQFISSRNQTKTYERKQETFVQTTFLPSPSNRQNALFFLPFSHIVSKKAKKLFVLSFPFFFQVPAK